MFKLGIPLMMILTFLLGPAVWAGPQAAPDIEEADRQFEKLYARGSYDEALVIGEQLLQLREKSAGPENLPVAELLVRLAALYRAMGEFGKAENSYRRAIAIGEKSLGPHHPLLGAALERFACFLRRRDRKDDADSFEKRALNILAPLPPGFRPGPVAGTVIAGKRITLAKPSYPKVADRLGVEGSVSVLVTIDETGKPITACTSAGPEVLALNAETAAFKSRWTPTTLDKIPVRVLGQVNYDFKR
jgi:tetratricopeptide (TPR) repeat protein